MVHACCDDGSGAVVQAEVRDLPAEIQVEHARLDPGELLVGVDLEHAVESRGDDHEGIVDRRRAAGQAGAAPSRHERPVVARRDPDRVGDLPAVAGEAHDRGPPAGDARVACVQRELQRFGARLAGSECRLQVGEERVRVVDASHTMTKTSRKAPTTR